MQVGSNKKVKHSGLTLVDQNRIAALVVVVVVVLVVVPVQFL